MDLETSILTLIQRRQYKGMDAHHLAKALHMEEHDSFIALCKALNRMEDAYILFTDSANRYFTKEQLGYVVGELRINPKGFGFVESEDASVYIHKDNLGLALNNDSVVARIWENGDGTKEGEIIRILKHSMIQVVGTIKIKGKTKYFLPDAFFNHRRFHITNMNRFSLVNDSKVLVHIDRFAEILEGHIETVVGYKYDPGVDMLSLLYEHGIDPAFDETVMKEVSKIPDTLTDADKKGRRSLLDWQIITIDGEDSRDLDDAISVMPIDNGYRLGVHIADVSYYVREKTALNAAAYERGTSIYVTDRVVPMLPHALSNGICSLNPHVERLTLSCVMDINAKGEVMKYELFPSYIKSSERMTYTKVNAILRGDEAACRKYAHILSLCVHMRELAQVLRKRREALGAIDFDTREAKIIVNEKGIVKDVRVRERGEAERIIEDFMIAANECVAAHMKWMEIPSMYRIHETPEPKKMRELARICTMLGYPLKADVNHVYPNQLQALLYEAKEDEVYPVLSSFMLRSMQKARYDAHCLGHFGLGLQEYLHFTSPIRRYPDLVVHRMLRKYCFNAAYEESASAADEQWMEEAANQCSKRERNAIETERDADDMKKAEYMERFIGAEFDGVISGVTRFGLFVELENTIEGLIHITALQDDVYHYDERGYCLIGERTGRKYRMGQSVHVRCVDASRFKKQVDFELAPSDDPNQKEKSINHRETKQVMRKEKKATGAKGMKGKQRKGGKSK